MKPARPAQNLEFRREREPDLRRQPRARVSWAVTVEVAGHVFRSETKNLSPFGAKLRLRDARLEPGIPAHLCFQPPGGRPLGIQAIVWRIDPDGPAFFFIDGQHFVCPTEVLGPVAPQR